MPEIVPGPFDSYADLYRKYKNQLAILTDAWDEERAGHCEEYKTLTLEEKVLVDNDMEYLKKHRVHVSMSNKEIECMLSILVKRDREKCGNN